LLADYYFDYVDPGSGLLMNSSNPNFTHSESDALQTFLKYKIALSGGCQIAYHPVFKEKFYPASIFTNAPKDLLDQVFNN